MMDSVCFCFALLCSSERERESYLDRHKKCFFESYFSADRAMIRHICLVRGGTLNINHTRKTMHQYRIRIGVRDRRAIDKSAYSIWSSQKRFLLANRDEFGAGTKLLYTVQGFRKLMDTYISILFHGTIWYTVAQWYGRKKLNYV